MSWVAAAISVVELLVKTVPQDAAVRLEPMLKLVLANQAQLLQALRELEDETTLKVQQAMLEDMAASCGAYAAGLRACAVVVQEQHGQLGGQADVLRRMVGDASHLAFKTAQPQYRIPAHQLLAGIITTCRLAYRMLGDAAAERAFVAQLRELAAPLYEESRQKVLAAQQESEHAKREAARHAAYCESDKHVTTKGGGTSHAPSPGFQECTWTTTYTISGGLEQGFAVDVKNSVPDCTWQEKRARDETWGWLEAPAAEEKLSYDREQRGAAAGAQVAVKAANAAAVRYRSAQRQLQCAQLLVRSADAVGKALA